MNVRHLGALGAGVLVLVLSVPASAAMVLASYTLDFRPPSPNDCSTSGLGDLSGATLSGALNFATVDATGSLVTINPGPIQISGVVCGTSYSSTFSFDTGAANPAVYVSFGGDIAHPPSPNLPTYAFAPGTDPASLTDPGTAPWIPVPVFMEKPPNPNSLPLYAFSGGAYQVGALDITLQAVPLPGAVGLFCSGLIGLIGLARRKAA